MEQIYFRVWMRWNHRGDNSLAIAMDELEGSNDASGEAERCECSDYEEELWNDKSGR